MNVPIVFCKKVFFCIIISTFFSIYQINGQSITLNGSSQSAGVTNNAALKLANFTLEAWIKIEGTGIVTASGTGSGGHANIVPIITKGRAELEVPVQDVNYFLGYDLTTRKLLADFEDNATSANHPVTGNAVLGNCWTHVAASYNTITNTWKLYVNGVLDVTLPLGAAFTPQFLSDVSVGIGTAFNSTGVASGFFNGRIDKVRIWTVARTDIEISNNYNAELTSGSGLASRWGFNEGAGAIASNSIVSALSAGLNNSPVWKPGFNQGNPNGSNLDFNGTNNYVTFGAAPGLNASSFTLEAWINIEGTGITTSTSGAGGGGFEGATAVVPLVTKGRGEAETPANLNINYFMGLVGNKLAADFEEASGPNHAVIGIATIPLNTWTHVAATYDPATAVWNLYINGVLDRTLDIGTGINPANTSIQHAAVGTGMTSTGVAGGFFNGKIDEVRIWNVVRSGTEILNNYNAELTSGTGLLGRWGFDEGCGLTANNSLSGLISGTLSSNIGPVWGTSNFNSLPPNLPASPSPIHNGLAPNISPNICATVSDPNGGNLQQVRFYGRKKTAVAAKSTIIGLPDTQFYTEEPQGANSSGGGHNGIFKAQTQWIADHRIDSNIAFVIQLGDCTQNGDAIEIEWKRADTSMKKIENPNVPTADGIPYGICVGNHDQGPIGNPDGTSAFYNQYFGETRFTGRGYYGGHYGSNNDNHYQLFSAGGIDFIQISLEYYANGTTSSLQPVLDWADGLLKTHSTRKGIVSTHNMLGTGNPASFQGPGQKIYDDLKDNPNLFLMLCGHVAGEGRRSDVFNGNTVHTVMSDYQSGFTNGGNGYLRIMQFLPDQNLLSVKTYSPYSNTSLTGASSSFTLPVNLSPSFTLIGTNANVPSGSVSCFTWPLLEQSSEYEWYVEVSDGETTTTGPVWTFTTPVSGPLPVTLTNFKAVAKNNTSVKINWSTTNETNNSFFEIQRSRDGKDFTSIGTVPGTNNAGIVQQYEFYDYQPLMGSSFYRLKQVDINSSSVYSEIERVTISNFKKSVDLYPNPAAGKSFTIALNGNTPDIFYIKIFDNNGQLLLQREVNGIRTLTVNHQLSKGTYTVKITGKQLNETKKLVIQ
jgi:Concanavalin A-like lectin/glucanases superfamily/Secretion system C-terminal sorting domain/Calcineurin-like phosphoesterase